MWSFKYSCPRENHRSTRGHGKTMQPKNHPLVDKKVTKKLQLSEKPATKTLDPREIDTQVPKSTQGRSGPAAPGVGCGRPRRLGPRGVLPRGTQGEFIS